MDAFDALVVDAQLCVGVLANRDVTDIQILPLKGVPYAAYTVEGLKRQFAGRDLHLLGTVGLVNGVPHAAFDAPLDALRISALFAAFATYREALLDGSLEQAQKGDAVEFLRRLASLEDPRTSA